MPDTPRAAVPKAVPGAVLGVVHTAPGMAVPPGACDCHTHVFGTPAQYPYDPARRYTPDLAPTAELLAHQRALGLDRVVIVQPSPYGTDNSCTLDAMREIGDAARGVAVIGPDTPDAALHAMHGAGMRGVRLNLETAGHTDPAYAMTELRAAAARVAPLGWHVQVYTWLSVLAALHDTVLDLPVPLVVDHFGRADAGAGPDQPGFDRLLSLVRAGKAYVKLSAPHRMGAGAPTPAGDDAMPIAAALIAANPERMLWGSDWPHPGGGGKRDPREVERFDPVDDGLALQRLARWVGDQATLRRILVDNPARLYGFPG